MRKYFLCIILIIINIQGIFTMPKTYPVSDEAAILTSEEFEIGALCGFYMKFHVMEKNMDKNTYFFQSPYCSFGIGEFYNWDYENDNEIFEKRYFENISLQYMFLIIPCLNLSFNISKGLENGFEIGYSMFLSTPHTYSGELFSLFYGPHYKFLFYFKKNLLNKNTAISYRFSFELDYNSGPGFDTGIKNSFLFGKNDKRKSSNFIISLYSYFGYEYYTFNGISDSFYTGLIPQLEYTSSVCTNNGFNFVFSFYSNFNFRYIFINEERIVNDDNIYYTKTFSNVMQFSVNMGIQLSFQKRVNKNN